MDINLKTESLRTIPDYIIYSPKSSDGSTGDTGNEHFLVFDGPDGNYMAVWTQSTIEGYDDQRLMFSTSPDKINWSTPEIIAGNPAEKKGMASWGFPLVSKSGRIYVLYNKHIGINDMFKHTTGVMAGVYSDDNGKTWSNPELITMPKSEKWDNPDPAMPSNWIIWQKPERVSNGKYFSGFTRWVSPVVRPQNPFGTTWWGEDAVVEFMRFENIDDNPDIVDIDISYFAQNEDAVQVEMIDNPDHVQVQEPTIVKLPDNRLFCIMRTTLGCPYYVISSDAGETWSKPLPLRFTDNGNVIPHPMSPAPIYDIGSGEYLFFYHNHNGYFGRWTPKDSNWHRRPIVMSRATFIKNAAQPLEFSDPEFFMDNNGVGLGINGGRADLAMYSSMTIKDNIATLWYPERKFFLLGKNIKIQGK